MDLQPQGNDAIAAATKLLPAWFTERMMTDSWVFGLLLSSGQVLVFETITALHQAADGSLWIEVLMLDHGGTAPKRGLARNLILAPTSRCEASVNVAHVLCAFELADT